VSELRHRQSRSANETHLSASTERENVPSPNRVIGVQHPYRATRRQRNLAQHSSPISCRKRNELAPGLRGGERFGISP